MEQQEVSSCIVVPSACLAMRNSSSEIIVCECNSMRSKLYRVKGYLEVQSCQSRASLCAVHRVEQLCAKALLVPLFRFRAFYKHFLFAMASIRTVLLLCAANALTTADVAKAAPLMRRHTAPISKKVLAEIGSMAEIVYPEIVDGIERARQLGANYIQEMVVGSEGADEYNFEMDDGAPGIPSDTNIYGLEAVSNITHLAAAKEKTTLLDGGFAPPEANAAKTPFAM